MVSGSRQGRPKGSHAKSAVLAKMEVSRLVSVHELFARFVDRVVD